MCSPDKLDEQQRQLVEQLRAVHPDLEQAYHLSQAFVSMLAEHRGQDLDDWLIRAFCLGQGKERSSDAQ